MVLDHHDWDLSGYRGAKSDYWVDEATEEVPVSIPLTSALKEVGATEDTPVGVSMARLLLLLFLLFIVVFFFLLLGRLL